MLEKTFAIQKMLFHMVFTPVGFQKNTSNFVYLIFIISMPFIFIFKEVIFGSIAGAVSLYVGVPLIFYLYNEFFSKRGLLFHVPLKKSVLATNVFIFSNLIIVCGVLAVLICEFLVIVIWGSLVTTPTHVSNFVEDLEILFASNLSYFQHVAFSCFLILGFSNVLITIFFIKNKIVSLTSAFIVFAGFGFSIYGFNLYIRGYSEKMMWNFSDFSDFLSVNSNAWNYVGGAFLLAIMTAILGTIISTKLLKL